MDYTESSEILFVDSLLSSKNIEAFFSKVITKIERYFKVESYAFYANNSIDKTFVDISTLSVISSNKFSSENYKNIEEIFEDGIIDWIAREKRFKFLPHIYKDGSPIEYLIIPFYKKNSFLGVLICIVNINENNITSTAEKEIEHLTYFASIIFENFHFSILQQKNFNMQKDLLETGRVLMSKIFEKEVVENLVQTFCKKFGFNKVSIWEQKENSSITNLFGNSHAKSYDDIKNVFLRSEGLHLFNTLHPLSTVFKNISEIESGFYTISILNDSKFLICAGKDDFDIANFKEESFEWITIFINFFITAIKNARLQEKNIEAKKSLQENQKELFAASKMAAVGDLASSIAHEINTPLQVILGRLEILKIKQKDNIGTVRNISIVEEEVLRMSDMVKKLLDLATGGLDSEEEMVEVNITSTAESVIAFLSSEFDHEEVVLKKSGFENNYFIEGIPGLIKQLLINLFVNSIQALKNCNKYKEVGISIKMEGESVVITIYDNGPGIKQKDMQSIFKQFVSSKIQNNGHGIGLSVVKKIIDTHRGNIEVSSIPGELTKFNIILPLQNCK